MPRVTDRIRNGVDTEHLFATRNVIKAEPSLAHFSFRATNRWIHGSHSRTTIRDFYAAGQEDVSRSEAFVIDAGEPAILLGADTGASPAEHLLHALAACMTTSIVYVAAARGIRLREVRSHLEADMDMRGALGISDEPRSGFERIRATFTVKGDAPAVELRAVVSRAKERAPVLDTITNGVAVELEVAGE